MPRFQKTGDYACRFPECKNRVLKRQRFCGECDRITKQQLAAINRVLFPKPQPYTPKVVKVLHD